jgi:superoxide dismutase, Fe-Mn family
VVFFTAPLVGAVLLRWVGGSIEGLRQKLDSWLPSEEEAFGSVDLVPLVPDEVPALPFVLSAMEPQISAETMRQHHGVLEPRYLAALQSELASTTPSWSSVMHNANAVILHELYWQSLDTEPDSKPEGALSHQIARDFGSLDTLRGQFMETANGLRGCGWVLLAWSPALRRLVLVPVEQHSQGGLWGAVPLLAVDLWEHAWFLDRGGHKQAYLDAVWDRLNWGRAGSRYVMAVRQTEDFFEGLIA